MRAVALRRIEGEGMRSRFGQGKTGIRTYKMLGIMVYFFRLHIHHGKRTLSEIKGRHDGVLDTLLILLRRFETVDDQFDEVGLVSVQRCYFIQFEQFAVHTHLRISPLAHLLEKFLVMAFTAFDYRRKKVAFASAVVLHDQRDYLLVRITDHGLPRLRGIGGRCPCIQKAEEIVDFRNGTDGRTRVVAGRLLLYGDYRAEARNRFDLGFFQYAHEMLGICGKGIHVPALAFGIDRIEGKG